MKEGPAVGAADGGALVVVEPIGDPVGSLVVVGASVGDPEGMVDVGGSLGALEVWVGTALGLAVHVLQSAGQCEPSSRVVSLQAGA